MSPIRRERLRRRAAEGTAVTLTRELIGGAEEGNIRNRGVCLRRGCLTAAGFVPVRLMRRPESRSPGFGRTDRRGDLDSFVSVPDVTSASPLVLVHDSPQVPRLIYIAARKVKATSPRVMCGPSTRKRGRCLALNTIPKDGKDQGGRAGQTWARRTKRAADLGNRSRSTGAGTLYVAWASFGDSTKRQHHLLPDSIPP